MNKVRLAFFSDLHIRGRKIQSQTDFGAPSKWIPRKAIKALNNIKPDYIFGLGDLTTAGYKRDWQGYKKWLSKINAPVFDIFGNHDRDYTVFQTYNYGEEYFNLLGRVSDTKAVKIGNNIFILVSEEHDPEGNKELLTSTVPLKRFEFIEKILKKHSDKNNIFVLSHTLLRGTTAHSNDWSFNDISDWGIISKRFFNLFAQYPVVAHFTGHSHMDYRYRAKLENIDGEKYQRKVGKLVNGANFPNLPDTYFFNLPCVDTAHGWLGSNFALLRKLGKAAAKSKRSPFRWLYIKLEQKGPPIFDILYKSKINNLIGRPAVYYFDIIPGKKKVEMKTRWLAKTKDMESNSLDVYHPMELNSSRAEIINYDLSLRTKQNLKIIRDNWFEIPANQKGRGEFSKGFIKLTKIKGIKITADNLDDYRVLWQGSKDKGQTWTNQWIENPSELGPVNAVKLKIDFISENKPAEIKDIQVRI